MTNPNQFSPWPMEKRQRIGRRIVKEAERTARRIGAKGVVIIAFFQEGEYVHVQDGGVSPVPFQDLYKRMLAGHDMMETAGSDDVNLQ